MIKSILTNPVIWLFVCIISMVSAVVFGCNSANDESKYENVTGVYKGYITIPSKSYGYIEAGYYIPKYNIYTQREVSAGYALSAVIGKNYTLKIEVPNRNQTVYEKGLKYSFIVMIFSWVMMLIFGIILNEEFP